MSEDVTRPIPEEIAACEKLLKQRWIVLAVGSGRHFRGGVDDLMDGTITPPMMWYLMNHWKRHVTRSEMAIIQEARDRERFLQETIDYWMPNGSRQAHSERSRKGANVKNAKRSTKAERTTAKWQELADPLWRRNPKLTNKAVAELIANGKSSPDTIRRKIVNPKKLAKI